MMGTEISLSLGRLDLDWAKNARGSDHGALFQEPDRQRLRSDQIDYDYFAQNDDDEGLAAMEMGFARPLAQVLPRLELLGFTIHSVKNEYDQAIESWEEMRRTVLEGREPLPPVMPFSEFLTFLKAHPLADLSDEFVNDLEKSKVEGRFGQLPDVSRLPGYQRYGSHAYSELSYFGGLIGLLHPYSLLRLLGEVERNRTIDVVWQYGPLVDAGWASEREFTSYAGRRETFLIATEGSSDVHILQRAFALLRPGVVDFFRFIDVSESHPFSGTGSLRKFAEGLVKIDVQNQILFLFDNDAEGVEAWTKVKAMALPENMRCMVLPDMEAFRSFPARGPDGLRSSDINRRAAALECYLDLEFSGLPKPQVTWTNYKKEVGDWHGVLDHKERYMSSFFSVTPNTLSSSGYDTSKIAAVLDAICRPACGRCFEVGTSLLSDRSPLPLPATPP